MSNYAETIGELRSREGKSTIQHWRNGVRADGIAAGYTYEKEGRFMGGINFALSVPGILVPGVGLKDLTRAFERGKRLRQAEIQESGRVSRERAT